MLKILLTLSLTLFALPMTLCAQESRDPALDAYMKARLEADLELLLTWSQGMFTNTNFVHDQANQNVPESHRLRHDAYRFTRIDDVPGFGGSVTLGQSFKNADPNRPEFGVVISYEISLEHNGILSDVNYLPDVAPYVNAHQDHSLIRKLVRGKDTATNNDECHALIRRIGDQFISEHLTGTCSYVIMNRPEVTNEFISMVGENERWVWSVGTYADGKVRYGNTDKVFNEYRRIDGLSFSQ